MKQTAILLPIDNRPITYLFPQFICQLAGLEVLVPPRQMMGSLVAATNIEALWDWLEQTVSSTTNGVLFICLDSLLYGGLIPARRSEDSLETILKRLAKIADLKKRTELKIYAQSSIMRISDNYDNTEEKSYWSKYGREIFHWSELLHKKESGQSASDSDLKATESKIPEDVRQDYLNTRARNSAVNEKIIDYVKSGVIDFLIFSQDDSGKYGLNVLEKEKLMTLAKTKNINNIAAYAGADEVLMTLIARYLNTQHKKPPQISVECSAESGRQINSNYEGQTIGKSFNAQANAQALKIADSATVDFTVIVHTGLDKQGDHIWLPGLKDLRKIDSQSSAQKAIQLIEQAKIPVVICDVAYSNGADPHLIHLLLKRPELFKRIWSYAGWNTTGNTIGCALAVASACQYASISGTLNDQYRLQLLWLRLMDDWAYQTQVRKELMVNQSTDDNESAKRMHQYELILEKALHFKPEQVQYYLPWHRAFEIEINLT